jgi:hypothetical protein
MSSSRNLKKENNETITLIYTLKKLIEEHDEEIRGANTTHKPTEKDGSKLLQIWKLLSHEVHQDY